MDSPDPATQSDRSEMAEWRLPVFVHPVLVAGVPYLTRRGLDVAFERFPDAESVLLLLALPAALSLVLLAFAVGVRRAWPSVLHDDQRMPKCYPYPNSTGWPKKWWGLAVCSRENGIKHILTAPRSPTTTGKVERWHKTLREDFLTGKVFESVADAQAQLDVWVHEYNHDRRHQGIGVDPSPRCARRDPRTTSSTGERSWRWLASRSRLGRVRSRQPSARA